MAADSEFAHYMVDVFRLFGPVTLRRMFGGYGIFHEGLMFALVLGETLYLKADAENLGDFERHGLAQLTYERQGKEVGLSYYLAPESLLDDAHEAAQWARRSFDAALRSNAPKKKARRIRIGR